ncbi:MAG: flagellar protein FlaG [Idiomarina sp.]|nr:flagellar protein FlaG [Idiomarina sp.]
MSIETTNRVDTNLVNSGPRVDQPGNDVRERPVLAENQTDRVRNVESPRDALSQTEEAVRLSVEQTEVEAQEIASAVDNMNEVLVMNNRQLQFTIDEDANRTVISVLDSESGETIRQIPSEDVLRLIARMQEMGSGIDSAVGVLIDSQI